MNKRFNNILLLCLVASFALVSCNKTKKFSGRLAGSTWNITELVIDGAAETELPSMEFKACDDIYETLCEGHWVDDHGDEAEFYWQLRSSDDEFQLSYLSEEGDGHDHDHDNQALAIQVSNLSGTYTYADFTKTDLTLTSMATVGYTGKLVTIKLKKQ